MFPPLDSLADHRALHNLRDALSAQLMLLDGFFPLQGWIVARRHNGEFQVLASQGSWCHNQGLNVLGELMHGHWTAYSSHPGFQFRKLDDNEKDQLSELLLSTATPDCVIRRPLRNSDGRVLAWLIGAANQDAVNRVTEPSFPVEYVAQAVVGMSLSLSLHTDLSRVQHELTELQRDAFIEPLTGILNRAGWINRVQHLEAIVDRTEEDVAVIMLDLDLLKLVNDMDGHSAGDELLQLTAQTVQSVVRRSDVVGRLGGDEFGVAVRGVDPVLAQSLVDRLRSALDSMGVDVSIGMALTSEAGTMDDTFILADRRMYDEKRTKPAPERAMNWQRNAVVPDRRGLRL